MWDNSGFQKCSLLEIQGKCLRHVTVVVWASPSHSVQAFSKQTGSSFSQIVLSQKEKEKKGTSLDAVTCFF